VIATAEPTVPDPLLYGPELPCVVTLFPLGYAVEIATNCQAIEAASHALWSRFPRLIDSAAIRLRIVVSDRDAEIPHAPRVTRGQEHLVSIVGGSDNFAVADLRQGFGFAWLTRDVAADQAGIIRDFLEPLVYLMVAARHFAQVHASCVSFNGHGVVLCGGSGAGKTCLAYACARAGWQFVSGDAIQIVRSSGGSEIIGRPYSVRFRESARALFPELQHRPATRTPHGKADIEVGTSELAIETSLEARASHVVFLNCRAGVDRPFFDTVPFDEAFSYLAQAVFYGDDALRAEQRRCLAELLTRPVLRLTYSRLDDAERALRGLIA
jgi:hypothetical protein